MELFEATALFPALSDEDYQALKADIAKNGQQDPIYFYQHRLLDGRHRLRACQELEIVPEVKEWDGECGNPLAFVTAKNLHRRHLTASQRAMIAAQLLLLINGGARKKPHPLNGEEKTENHESSDRQVAKKAQVDPKTVRKAKLVLEKGTADEIKAVTEGSKTVHKAATQIQEQPRADRRRKPRAPKKRQLSPPAMTGNEFIDKFGRALIDLASLPPSVGLIETVRKSEMAGVVDDALPKAIKWLAEFSEQWNQAWEAAEQQ